MHRRNNHNNWDLKCIFFSLFMVYSFCYCLEAYCFFSCFDVWPALNLAQPIFVSYASSLVSCCECLHWLKVRNWERLEPSCSSRAWGFVSFYFVVCLHETCWKFSCRWIMLSDYHYTLLSSLAPTPSVSLLTFMDFCLFVYSLFWYRWIQPGPAVWPWIWK